MCISRSSSGYSSGSITISFSWRTTSAWPPTLSQPASTTEESSEGGGAVPSSVAICMGFEPPVEVGYIGRLHKAGVESRGCKVRYSDMQAPIRVMTGVHSINATMQ